MKNTSQIRSGIILNYINEILGSLIPFFYTPVMLSLLGQAEYGLYKLSGGVTSYLSLVSLGIGSAVTRYLIKARTEEGKDAEEKILGLFMIIFQVIAAVSLLIGIILTLNLQVLYRESLTDAELSRMRILVFLMVCNTALSFSLSPYVSVVTAHEKFIFLQSMNIIMTCAAPMVNLIVLFLGYSSIGMAASSLALGVITRLLYFLFVRRSLSIKAQYRGVPKHLLQEILVFSFWIFVSNVVSQLYNSTDTIMIGAVPALAAVGVAVYNVGSVFNHMVFSLTTGVSNLLSPKTTRMVFSGASSRELTDLAIKVGRLQGYIFALLVSGFISFGRPFIHFYTGDGYLDAYWVAVLMMVPNMIPLVQSVCLSIIIAQNKHRFRSLVYLGIAILNVIGTWFLMHTSLGIIGAALMTGAALVLGQGLIMNWYYWKKTGLEIGRFWKELGKVYIIPAGMCIIASILGFWINYYNLGVLVAGILVYTVVYCVLCMVFVMNSYERGLIRDSIQQVTQRLHGTGGKG